MASRQEQVWLAEYLKTFNASEAARRAGYRHPDVLGHRKKVKFAAQISAALSERVMEADEALAHLSDQARTDLSDYISNDGIDVDRMVADGLGHLIKSVKHTVTQYDDRVEVEIYDKQAALKIILDHHDRAASGTADDPHHILVKYVHDWRNQTND